MHPDNPNIIRIHALIGIMILAEGKIPNTLSEAVCELYYRNGNFYKEDLFPVDFDPEEFNIPPLTEDQKNYLTLLKQNSQNSQFDDKLPYLCLEYWLRYLFYLKPGANESLAPILIDIFSKSEDEIEEIMEVTLTQIPDTSEKRIQLEWHQLSKGTIEALIAELYQTDCITFKEAQNLLGRSSWQHTAEILEKHGCELYYDRDDFEQDIETLETIDTK